MTRAVSPPPPMPKRTLPSRRLATWLGLLLVAARPAPAEDIVVIDRGVIHWQKDQPLVVESDGSVVRSRGQVIDQTIELPPAPADPADARRIVAIVEVEPVSGEVSGHQRPNDLWTRLGQILLLEPAAGSHPAREIELVRFATGYGGTATFEQDITPLAPLLHGRRTLRAFVSSYSEKPSWQITVTLRYTREGVGARRPVLARPVFADPHLTAEAPTLSAEVSLPPGLDPPRLRILTTGHATDGLAGNEFLTCTHVLRIDGREVARWRPWAEAGGVLRDKNPWAGRDRVGDRELRASDLDRSGWHPGEVVTPVVIPVPELSAGRHRIELEILGIRPKGPPDDEDRQHHGYWNVSAIMVADDPWPAPADRP